MFIIPLVNLLTDCLRALISIIGRSGGAATAAAGGVAAPPTTSQTVGGSVGEGVFAVGVVADAILLVLCSRRRLSEGCRRRIGGKNAWRRKAFCGVCDEKNQAEGAELILPPAMKSKLMAL